MNLQGGDIGVERRDDRPACGGQSVAEILYDRVVTRIVGVELHVALQLRVISIYLCVDRRTVDRERSGNQFVGFGRIQQVFLEEFRHSDLVFQREPVNFVLGAFGDRLLGFRYDVVYFVVLFELFDVAVHFAQFAGYDRQAVVDELSRAFGDAPLVVDRIFFIYGYQRIDDILRLFGNGASHGDGDDRCLFVGYETFDFVLIELRYHAQVAFGNPDRGLFVVVGGHVQGRPDNHLADRRGNRIAEHARDFLFEFLFVGAEYFEPVEFDDAVGIQRNFETKSLTVVVIDKIHCDRILSVEILGTQSLLGFVLNGQSQLLDHFRHKTARLEDVDFIIYVTHLRQACQIAQGCQVGVPALATVLYENVGCPAVYFRCTQYIDVAASDADYHRDDEPVPVGDYRLDQVVHRESNVFLLLYVVIRGVRFDIVGCHALIVKIIG